MVLHVDAREPIGNRLQPRDALFVPKLLELSYLLRRQAHPVFVVQSLKCCLIGHSTQYFLLSSLCVLCALCGEKIYAASITNRNPICPAELSGVDAVLAAGRYRLQ